MSASMKSIVERTLQSASHEACESNIAKGISPDFLDQAERVCGRYVVPIVCLFGIACNALNLLVLTHRQMRGSPYTYLLGLAVTDLSVLTLSVIESALSKPYGKGIFFWQVYETYVFLPIANVFTSSSVWITVLLTIERYISVRYPLKAKELCTSRLARRAIVVVVLLATIVNLPRFFCEEIVPCRRQVALSASPTPTPRSVTSLPTTVEYRWNPAAATSTAIETTPTSTADSVSMLTTGFLIVPRSTAGTSDLDNDLIVGYVRTSTEFAESSQYFVAWTWFSIATVHAVPCVTLLSLNAGLIVIVCRASRRRAALRGGPGTSGSHGSGSVTCTLAQQQQQQQRTWPMRWRSSPATLTVRWWARSTAGTVGESATINGVLVGGDGSSSIIMRQHSSQQHHHSTEQIRMTVTCISIICLFLVCIIPSAFSNRAVAKALFGRDKKMDEFTKSPFYRLMRVVTNLLVCCNLSLNFLLYCVFNHKFLHTLRQIGFRYWSLAARRADTGRGDLRETPLPSSSNRAPGDCRNFLCCRGCGNATPGPTEQAVVGGGGSVGAGVGTNPNDVALNRLYSYRVSSTTSGGSAGRNSGVVVGEVVSRDAVGSGAAIAAETTSSKTPNEFLVLEVEAGLPVVISMQRRRAGYEAMRSATCSSMAFQFPVKERLRTRHSVFN